MILRVGHSAGAYDIRLGRGELGNFGAMVGEKRKVLVVTDNGVPATYVKDALSQCANARLFTLAQGEKSKNFESLRAVLHVLLANGFGRGDCIVALGGGMVGDLGGFAASCYMRGIGFYTVPTTLLAQVDSSVGGKTAIDFEGVKNAVGAFYRPDGVLIDPDVLTTLPRRQIASGMAEIVKMAMTSDVALFDRLDGCTDPTEAVTEKLIADALKIKISVVEQDEKEKGLRRVLNFGHTIGHGIESAAGGALLHGECVALGMIPMTVAQERGRLIGLLQKIGLPTECRMDAEAVMQAVLHDKKSVSDGIMTIKVDKIGQYRTEKMTVSDLKTLCEIFAENGNYRGKS